MLVTRGQIVGIGAMPTEAEERARIEELRAKGRFWSLKGGEGDPTEGDPAKTGGDPKPGNGAGSEDEFPDGIGDAGKEAIRRERKAARDAERKLKEFEEKLEKLEKDSNDLAELKRKEAEASGDWQKLAKDRETEIANLTTERDGWKGKYDTLVKVVAPGVKKAWEATPEEIRDLYDGKDDDVLALQAHMEKYEKLAEKLKAPPERKPGDPVPPRSNGERKPDPDKVPAPMTFKQITG